MSVTLGGFGLSKDVEAIIGAGFDYAEIDAPELEAMDMQTFCIFRRMLESRGFPVKVAGRILPTVDPILFASGFEPECLRGYLSRCCQRAAELHVKMLVFGNGKARMRPNAFVDDAGFVSFMRMLCNIAAENGLLVLIEPLGPGYSNFINRISDAAEYIKRLNTGNLYILADLRHLYHSGEPFENLFIYKDLIRHIHIDYPVDYPRRAFPSVNDGYDYGPFFYELRRAGYSGGITVEAEIPENWKSAFLQVREMLLTYNLL